jgi:aminoglycoside N3'-acetyltransferase
MTIAHDLRDLGLQPGNAVLVRAASAAISPGKKGNATELRDAVLDVIGVQGTLVALAFTASQYRRNSSPRTLFTAAAPTIAGGFSAAVLKHENCVRSAHPFNSIAAIGPHAAHLCDGHGQRALAFSWMEKFIQLGGKQIVIGCVDSSPGFSTIHHAQERLGLSTRTLFPRYGTYIRQPDGREEWVTQTDVPGCSLGFHRLYTDYILAGVIRTGHIGEAYSIFASAAKTFPIDLKVLAANPRSVLCGWASCPSCSTRTYNLRRIPSFLAAQAAKALARKTPAW